VTDRANRTSLDRAIAILAEEGFDGMAQAFTVLLNEVMRLERSEFLGAEPHERTAKRRGHANGFKPKRVKTRVGAMDLKVPQVRGVQDGESFYPRSLELGQRSERALRLAVAEMYVQGVSTRRVTEITRELCGLDVSSTDVSRAASRLDVELEQWRTRPLGFVPYVVLDARYEKVRHGGSVRDCALLTAIGIDVDMILDPHNNPRASGEVYWDAAARERFAEGLYQLPTTLLASAWSAYLTGNVGVFSAALDDVNGLITELGLASADAREVSPLFERSGS